jgi:hypothetical protein
MTRDMGCGHDNAHGPKLKKFFASFASSNRRCHRRQLQWRACKSGTGHPVICGVGEHCVQQSIVQ